MVHSKVCLLDWPRKRHWAGIRNNLLGHVWRNLEQLKLLHYRIFHEKSHLRHCHDLNAFSSNRSSLHPDRDVHHHGFTHWQSRALHSPAQPAINAVQRVCILDSMWNTALFHIRSDNYCGSKAQCWLCHLRDDCNCHGCQLDNDKLVYRLADRFR